MRAWELLARATHEVDRAHLEGGAIGFAGGGTRHQIDASANLSDREVGVRLSASWRSASTLNTGSAAAPSRLLYSPVAVVSVRAFADLQQLWPGASALKDTRVSLNLVNLFNQRQRVVGLAGATPLRYQPAYRDALGRTIELELRRAF